MARRRYSFTLVELLLVMMILAIMASMTMFALYGVMDDAKEARTRAQIAKLNELIMDRWTSYEIRAVPVKVNPGLPVPGTVVLPNSPLYGRAVAAYRLAALRELMRFEMPDRIADVASNSVTTNLARPALSQQYQRRATAGWSVSFQGAECLYLIVASMRDGDSNGLDFFKSSEIGDTDNDGMKEILDGFGMPIEFIRWPVGFDSPLQPLPLTPAEFVSRNEQRPDPFDPLKVDQLYWKLRAGSSAQTRLEDVDNTNNPFGIFPLVYSPGRDKLYDINNNAAYSYAAAAYSPPGLYGANDPYANINTTNAIGTRMDANGDGAISYFDNITNHLTGNE